MRVDDCYQLGYITKTHGLKGELQLMLDVDHPDDYKDLESMFVLKDNTLVPFFLEYVQVSGNKTLIKLDEIDSIEEAKPLVSSEVYLPLSFLPELEDHQFYFHELIDFQFFDKKKLIGVVKNVYTFSSQNLMEVDHNGIEILVPLNDGIIDRVDKQGKRVYANLPDGLLDVYLNENAD